MRPTAGQRIGNGGGHRGDAIAGSSKAAATIRGCAPARGTRPSRAVGARVAGSCRHASRMTPAMASRVRRGRGDAEEHEGQMQVRRRDRAAMQRPCECRFPARQGAPGRCRQARTRRTGARPRVLTGLSPGESASRRRSRCSAATQGRSRRARDRRGTDVLRRSPRPDPSSRDTPSRPAYPGSRRRVRRPREPTGPNPRPAAAGAVGHGLRRGRGHRPVVGEDAVGHAEQRVLDLVVVGDHATEEQREAPARAVRRPPSRPPVHDSATARRARRSSSSSPTMVDGAARRPRTRGRRAASAATRASACASPRGRRRAA